MKMEQQTRQNKVVLIVGARGGGKTFWMRQVLDRIGLKHLVIDTTDHKDYRHLPYMTPAMFGGWLKGNKRFFTSDFDPVFRELKKIYNAVIVLEDATKYIAGDLTPDQRAIMLDSKQKNVDVFLMYHSFADVPPKLYRYLNDIIVFPTNESIASSKAKIGYYDRVREAWEAVMAEREKYKHLPKTDPRRYPKKRIVIS